MIKKEEKYARSTMFFLLPIQAEVVDYFLKISFFLAILMKLGGVGHIDN